MLSDRASKQCLRFLRLMQSSNAQEEKWEEVRELYTLVLLNWQDAEAVAACEWAVLNLKWRPAPAELRQIAARQVSPVPSEDEIYAEIVEKVERHGLFAKQDPLNPNCYEEGPPTMSHPVAARCVALCGGWGHLCSGQAQFAEGLKKQISGVHKREEEKWFAEVVPQLSLPPEQRNPRHFGKYPKYVAASPDSPLLAELKAIPPRDKQIEPPIVNPDVLKMLRGSLKSISAPKRSATAQSFDRPETVLTKEKRAELEAEAKEITARVERTPTAEEVDRHIQAAREKRERAERAA